MGENLVTFIPKNSDKKIMEIAMQNDADNKLTDGFIVVKTVTTSAGIYVYYKYDESVFE